MKTAPRGARFLCCQYIIEEEVAKLELPKQTVNKYKIVKKNIPTVFIFLQYISYSSLLYLSFNLIYFYYYFVKVCKCFSFICSTYGNIVNKSIFTVCESGKHSVFGGEIYIPIVFI